MYLNFQILLLMLLSFFSILHGNDNPLFIQKYIQKLPMLESIQDECILLPQEKAHVIARYLYCFMPKKVFQESQSLPGSIELESKLTNLIVEKKSISLLLLGFPFKSRNNEKKCISANIDMGEYLALVTLHQLIKNIQSVYPHSDCTIVSDGLAYHLDDYDASIDQIQKYHAQMTSLIAAFPDLSFISWQINNSINSYQELQKEVASIRLKNTHQQDKTRYNEMKTFASTEFACTFWEKYFMELATVEYGKQQNQDLNKKLKDQKIRTIKNKLITKKIESIVPDLVNKGKQFSTFVKVGLPCYQDYIRLSVHCDKNINVYEKIPLQLIHNYQGTPWHNALVINESRDEVEGFAKDIFKNKLNLINQQKKVFLLQAAGTVLPLSYVIHESNPL